MFIPRTPSPILQPVITSLVYFATATLALLTSRFEGALAFIWVANAFLMAELLTTPTSYWWRPIAACTITSAIATTLFGMGPQAAIPMAVINMAEALIVASLHRHFVPGNVVAGSLKPLLVFVAALCCVANVVGAFGSAFIASAVTGKDFWTNWLAWYTGHVLGALICGPSLVVLLQGEAKRWLREAALPMKLEAVGLLALFTTISWVTFHQTAYPMLFLPMLPLVLIAFRIGHLGASAAILVLVGIGGFATLTGAGPIDMIDGPIGERTQFFQFYLAFSFLISVPVAAELNGRKRLFQMLRDSEARYRIIADHSGDVVLNIDAEGIIQYASPSVTQRIGQTPEAMVGRSATDFVDAGDRALVIATHHKTLSEPGAIHMVEFRRRESSGNTIWYEMVAQAILDERGVPTGIVSTLRDMSRHKAVERELKAVANVDELTGAATRRAFLERLDKIVANGSKSETSCLALIDVDHFKRVNDQYGHAVGDRVLRAFIDELRPEVRDGDMIGRLGGEEFAILLTNTDLAHASTVCERLRAMVASMIVPVDARRSLSITFSAGLVQLNDMEDGTTALEAADKALYQAKHGGRNCIRLAA
ncbi:diguanylate cyclase [Sphingobium aromaticiconvertens]|uniref:sensor domain-containing diguanylate cyclase n=1 Tax=Sphingobium aromaticiconvertens TaxID=365341 RepID=UPI003016558F